MPFVNKTDPEKGPVYAEGLSPEFRALPKSIRDAFNKSWEENREVRKRLAKL